MDTADLQPSNGPFSSSQGSREFLQAYHHQNMEKNREVISLLTEIRESQREFHSGIKHTFHNIDKTLNQILSCKKMRLTHDLGMPMADLLPGSRAPEAQQAKSSGSDDEQSTD